MEWKRAKDAARDWAGGISVKTLYAAVQRGQLKAARIGAGRNMLFCQQHVDQWLSASAERAVAATPALATGTDERPRPALINARERR